jgi:hypothetical protein
VTVRDSDLINVRFGAAEKLVLNGGADLLAGADADYVPGANKGFENDCSITDLNGRDWNSSWPGDSIDASPQPTFVG